MIPKYVDGKTQHSEFRRTRCEIAPARTSDQVIQDSADVYRKSHRYSLDVFDYESPASRPENVGVRP